MGCQHLEELFELWLMGALSEQGSREILEHLRGGCADCLTRVRDAAETIYILGLSSKPVRPHPRVKAELLRSISRKAAQRR